MSVGVMKDYKLKQRNLRASHTLGWSWKWNTCCVFTLCIVRKRSENSVQKYLYQERRRWQTFCKEARRRKANGNVY
jgi:hypothetical protein